MPTCLRKKAQMFSNRIGKPQCRRTRNAEEHKHACALFLNPTQPNSLEASTREKKPSRGQKCTGAARRATEAQLHASAVLKLHAKHCDRSTVHIAMMLYIRSTVHIAMMLYIGPITPTARSDSAPSSSGRPLSYASRSPSSSRPARTCSH